MPVWRPYYRLVHDDFTHDARHLSAALPPTWGGRVGYCGCMIYV